MCPRITRKLSHMRILVVDDLVDTRRFTATLLKAAGFENVIEAASGEDALSLLASDEEIDLVLLDIVMPSMDGREVLQFIKSRIELKAIPVIMVTALKDVDSVIECIERGAEDYLIKPIDEDHLRTRVRTGLLTRRVRNVARGTETFSDDSTLDAGPQ